MQRSQSVLVLERQKSLWRSHRAATLLLVLFACFWGLQYWKGKEQEAASDTYTHSEATRAPFLGRNLARHTLQQQITDQENEIRQLEHQIRVVMHQSKLRIFDLQEAQRTLQALQEQEQQERHALTKVQLVLASKVKDLSTCNYHNQLWEYAMANCGDELDAAFGQLQRGEPIVAVYTPKREPGVTQAAPRPKQVLPDQIAARRRH